LAEHGVELQLVPQVSWFHYIITAYTTDYCNSIDSSRIVIVIKEAKAVVLLALRVGFGDGTRPFCSIIPEF